MEAHYSIVIKTYGYGDKPDIFFSKMCRDRLIHESWFDNPTTTFGEWEWILKREYEKEYLAAFDAVGKHLSDLYRRNLVSYAAW